MIKVFLITITLFFLQITGVSASVYDELDLLTDKEEAEIAKAIEDTGLNIVVVTNDKINYNDIYGVSKELGIYDKDSFIIMIAMKDYERYVDFIAYGKYEKVAPESLTQSYTDKVSSSLASKAYAPAIITLIGNTESVAKATESLAARILIQLRYQVDWVYVIGAFLVVTATLAYYDYSTHKPRSHATHRDYLTNARHLGFYDRFTHMTKTSVTRSSSGGARGRSSF